MVELEYKTCSHVVDSWEKLRLVPNYQEVAGVLIFRKFFQSTPKALQVFTFGRDRDEADEKLFKSQRLILHAKHYCAMVDRAVGLLGPDSELLAEALLELGEKHSKFGVESSFYPPMGLALIETLEDILGADVFTEEIKHSWFECYQSLALEMMRATKGKRSR